MSYQVLAQKYRPQTFDDVIGQESVTRTLKNSVSQERVANAYIFCGPRGIGKTSVARLLSKVLNCEVALEKRPCNKCVSCKEITQGNNIDVLEIDGASNRGIDEIRTLRENVKFSPSKGKYKIYIIDEVHMLTPEAFNALLKTLEEPPAHVKFIFATTESHKVIPTIMSRCQRFDFKKIPPKMIFDKVMSVAKTEKIAIDEKAALLIARSADGSLRDALVILDQMASFSGKKVSSDDVIEVLGMIHRDKMFELAGAIVANDPKGVTQILDELVNNGKDPVFITNSLISHFRDIMVLKTAGAPTADMAFTEDELSMLKDQLEKLNLEEVLYILQNLTYCLTLMKGTIFARAPLEITLIKLTRRNYALSLPEIIKKIDKLEKTGGIDTSSFTQNTAPAESAPSSPVPVDTGQTVQKKHNPTPGKSSTKNFVEVPDENGEEGDGLVAAKYHWQAVLNHVKSKKMSVFTFLSVGKPIEFTEKKVIIGFDKDHAFNKEALETGDNRITVEDAVKTVVGNTPKIEFTLLEFLGGETTKKTDDSAEKKAQAREAVKPFIEKAMDVFGGQVVRDFKEESK